MRRQIIALFLFFLLVGPIALAFVVLELRKCQIKKEVKHRFFGQTACQDLALLKFNARQASTEINWEDDKEFEFRGKMYDVVKTETKAGTVFYWCWIDDEETSLHKQLDKLIAYACGDNTKNKQDQHRFSKFFDSLYFDARPSPALLVQSQDLLNNFRYLKRYPPFWPPQPIVPPEKV